MVAATLAPSTIGNADLDVVAAADQENTVESDLGPHITFQLFDAQHVSDLDPILLSTGFDDGVLRIVAGR